MSLNRPTVRNVGMTVHSILQANRWKETMKRMGEKSGPWTQGRRKLLQEQQHNPESAYWLPNMYTLSPRALSLNFGLFANPDVDITALGYNFHLVLAYLGLDFGKTSAELYDGTALPWKQIGQILRYLGGWLKPWENEADLYKIMPPCIINKLPIDEKEGRRVFEPLLTAEKYTILLRRMGSKRGEYGRARDKLTLAANEISKEAVCDFETIADLMFQLRDSPMDIVSPISNQPEQISLSDREINLLIAAQVIELPLRCYCRVAYDSYKPSRRAVDKVGILYAGPKTGDGRFCTLLEIDRSKLGEVPFERGRTGENLPISLYVGTASQRDLDRRNYADIFSSSENEVDIFDWEERLVQTASDYVSKSNLMQTMRRGGYVTRELNLPKVTNVLERLKE